VAGVAWRPEGEEKHPRLSRMERDYMQMIRINMIIARDWESLRQRYIASRNVVPAGSIRARRGR